MILKAIIDEVEVEENSSSSIVAQNKDGLCNRGRIEKIVICSKTM